jgi:hypothetical protein
MTRAHLTPDTAGQRGAVHVPGTARHRSSGVDVLLDRVLGEALRGDHLDVPGVDVVLSRDAEHAPEVVHMAVRVDDGVYRPVTTMASV